VDTKEDTNRRSRRRHDEALKRLVLSECAAPGASVAKVAMAHGLNANLVHKWRRTVGALAEPSAAAFIPVAVSQACVVSEPTQFVDVELQRGALSVRVRWPIAAGASCAAWMREILR
jgi:transposase